MKDKKRRGMTSASIRGNLMASTCSQAILTLPFGNLWGAILFSHHIPPRTQLSFVFSLPSKVKACRSFAVCYRLLVLPADGSKQQRCVQCEAAHGYTLDVSYTLCSDTWRHVTKSWGKALAHNNVCSCECVRALFSQCTCVHMHCVC